MSVAYNIRIESEKETIMSSIEELVAYCREHDFVIVKIDATDITTFKIVDGRLE